MRRLAWLTPAALFLAASFGAAAEMKAQLTFDRTNPRALQKLFHSYGYRPRETVFPEIDGFRFWLPAGNPETRQSGVYSYFAVAGDCEATANYALLNLEPPRTGYGSGVGLALDAGEGIGRGSIQRVCKTEGNGYVLQSFLEGSGNSAQDAYRFVANDSKWGRIGLRRINKELIFLASDAPGESLKELDRLPFTDRTIKVRFFADPGGSPTAIDARVSGIEVQAEEVTPGVPQIQKGGSGGWWWWGSLPAAGLLLFWFWRGRRRHA